jgi:IPT/TIG domain-containing protein/Calx-beta domain-containing protein
MFHRRHIGCLAVFAFVLAAPLRAQSVSFDKSSYTFKESAGVGLVTVTRTGDPATSLSVPYHADINAVIVDGTFTFQPNEMSKVFSVAIVNDGVYDQWSTRFTTTHFIELKPIAPVTIGTNWRAGVKLIEANPQPTIALNPIAVPEGNSGVTLAHMSATFSAPFKRDGTVLCLVPSDPEGTATPGSDYDTGFFGTSLPAGQTFAEFTVPIRGDQSSEPDEYFVVTVYLDDWAGFSPITTVTILNDDYILTPGSQRIGRGSVGSANLTTSVPSPTTDHVTLSSSNPSVVTVPAFVDVPAGSLGKTFDVTAVGFGSAVITATFPPSRGSTTTTTTVDVFAATAVSFEKQALNLALSQTATATIHFDPPPSEPLLLFLSQSNPPVAAIPAFVTVGTNGTGTFTLRGNGVGLSVISAAIPPFYGGGPASFGVIVSPPTSLTISRLDTTSGPSTGGQPVKIFAEPMSGRCTALFDGVSGQNTSSAAAGFVTTTTPPHEPGIVAVTLRCGGETSVLSDAYTYTPLAARLVRISPAIGGVGGGTVVSATGENFRRGRCSLSFGGVAATTMQNDSTTEMLVSTPSHAAGSTDVTMRCGNDVSTLTNAFVFTGGDPQTQLAGSNPASGAPGERILVAGSGFRDSDAIFFGDTAGLDVTTTSAEHFVTVPDLPPGNVTITLHDVSGRIVPGPVFHVLATVTPQIISAPSRITPSSEFLVNGAGFRRSLTFLLGGTALQQIEVASTFARLRLPESITPGSYPLTITGGTSTRTIEVAPGLTVISVSNPCSSIEGGMLVTITGNGFAAGAVVAFGGTDSSDVSVRDEHTIVATVPPSSGIMNATITVTNRNGDSAQLSNAFRYRSPDPGCSVPRHRGALH